MAKVSKKVKNEQRKILITRFKKKRLLFKEKTKDLSLPVAERFSAQVKLAELPKDSSRVRYKNRCELTGRPRANYRRFGLCRNMLRELANKGLIPGVKKSSW